MVVLAALKILKQCYNLSKNIPGIDLWKDTCRKKAVDQILEAIGKLPLGMICTKKMSENDSKENSCLVTIKKEDLEELLDIIVDPKNLMKKVIEIGILPTNIVLPVEKLSIIFLEIIIDEFENTNNTKKEEIIILKQELNTLLEKDKQNKLC